MILLYKFRQNLFSVIKTNMHHIHSYKNRTIVRELIMKYLNIDKKIVTNLTKADRAFEQLSEEHIKEISGILQTNNVNLQNIEQYGKVLCLKPLRLKHRIFLLQELGVKDINIKFLRNYTQIMNLSPAIFKAYMGLNNDANLVQNLYCYLDSAPSLPNIDENVSLNIYCQISLKHYLKWKLDISKEEEESILNKIQIQFKSFRIFESIISVLQNDFLLSNTKIKSNIKLINTSPEIIIPMYNKLQTITSDAAGMILRCPNLLNKNIDSISEMIDIIISKGIPKQNIRKWPEALLFTKDEFNRRLNTLLSYPELKIFLYHPRFLKLICYFHMVQIRIKYMREFSHKRSSVSLLTGNHIVFKNSVTFEKNVTDLNDLVRLLNKDFQMDETELKKQIKQHPYWKYTSLLQVQNTFDYLKKHFTLKDIYSNLYAVFYPSNSINKLLHNLKLEYCNTGGISYARTQYLALCIYKMELDHHFSGDGIWTEENQKLPELIEKDENLREKNHENVHRYYLIS